MTVLDFARSALDVARDELGFTGNMVAADLTEPEDRAAYRRTLEAAIEPVQPLTWSLLRHVSRET
ncbi:hypothetical protein [Catenulispora subtropica]|uniref:Uncharacterized protein n=1 Tax=Catenulispora subtropica TaxID=450798 RepID=A0ABP5C7K8_9ACTN